MILCHYVFWLLLVSLGCLLAERLRPWRSGQKLIRKEFLQDLFWLCFNGYAGGLVLIYLFTIVYAGLDKLFFLLTGVSVVEVALFASLPLVLQVVLYLIIADFLEWCIHYLLHRVPVLWRFHRLHHSIKTMDWIGNFRFHWMETIVYSTLKYLPLAVLVVHPDAALVVAVISTTIGHLNHSNLNISWGPMRYVLNSPRMHIWHHEKKLRGKAGRNFAVVFSIWDWLFRTAYFPNDGSQPEEIGFHGEEQVPRNILTRFFIPFINYRQNPGKS